MNGQALKKALSGGEDSRRGAFFQQLSMHGQEIGVFVVTLVIVGAIVYQTGQLSIVNNSSLVSSLQSKGGDALILLASFLSVIALAIAGRFALGALGSFGGGGNSKT